MKRCKLCKGEITEEDLISVDNEYLCSYCGEQQNEIDLIIAKAECTNCQMCKELGECVYEYEI